MSIKGVQHKEFKLVEIWKPVPDIEGIEASSEGRVRYAPRVAPSSKEGCGPQKKSGGVYSPWLGRSGYLVVSIKRGGSRPKYLVHRLICSAFHGLPETGLTVDHVNGDRLDNRSCNLEWVTRAENSRRQNADGRGVGKGELHPSSVITDEQACNIIRDRAAGVSARFLSDLYMVSESLVYKIAAGNRR